MDPRLASLEQELLDRYFDFHPGAALFAGLHQHDLRLEDLSPEALGRFTADLDRLRAAATRLEGLGPADAIEREVLLARVDQTLVEYRDLETPARDPYFHAETLSSQLNGLAIFDFAPLEERARAVIAKERETPRFLADVRRTLRPTAPMLRDYGIRGFEGALSLVRDDLPKVFAGMSSPALHKELAEATAIAGEAITSHLGWLRDGYPPGAEREYALGPERFTAWLAGAERITTPLAELERWALGAIEEAREGIAEEARRIDPGATAAAVTALITGRHPATGQVVAEATRIAEEVYAWMRAKTVVSFPTEDRVVIADTPEFMRWSFGSMWPPGPFETAKVRSTFYATDADPRWPAAQQEEHLTAFSYRGLENLAIHEAYPGHFVQMLHQHRAPSPVRKAFWWGVFGEGWAHYCEQMAIEEGFGGGAPEVRIVQLQEALARLCRFVNCIRLHTREDWGFDAGTRLFMDRAWLTETVARAECERAAFDPFYLRYSLGKKQILELRQDCRQALGAAFDLRRFHDALLGCGLAPMPQLAGLTRLALGID